MRRNPRSFAGPVSRAALGAVLVFAAGVVVATSAAAAEDKTPRLRGAVANEITIRNPEGQVVMQRIEPRARWNDLGVAEATQQLLRKIAAGPRAKSGSGAAIAQFTGADKAAKLRAAEVLAAELHLTLYRIDLSAVVSKYIGETEKNLAQVFAAAEGLDVVLFFDEADALFGKRTDVKDSHDRYANQEISHLLQRIEKQQGLAILATNQKVEIDPAIQRRFRHIVAFAEKTP